MKRRHQQEMNEAKHHTDLVIMELRQSIESEKSKTIADFNFSDYILSLLLSQQFAKNFNQ